MLRSARRTARLLLVLLPLLLLAPAVSARGQESTTGGKKDPLGRALRDWKRRSRSIKTLIAEGSGKLHYLKGACDVSDSVSGFKGPFPDRDCVKPISRKWWIDFERGFYRHEYQMVTPDFTQDRPTFSAYHQTLMFDGKFVYLTGVKTEGEVKYPWVVIRTAEVAEPLRTTGYEPIAWVTGNIAPLGVAANKIDDLRPLLARPNLTDAGDTIFRERRVRRIELAKRPPTARLAQRGYAEFYVDLERASLILRANHRDSIPRDKWNGKGKRPQPRVVFWFDFDYERRGDDWVLSGWSMQSQDPRLIPKETYRVKQWTVNPPIDLKMFKPRYRPGTRVTDATNPDDIRYYRIDENGNRVPQS